MIRIERVGKSFDGGRTFVVDDLSLHVREGEIVVLLGESGCGKTTTLKMINRLVEPTRGDIFVEGESVLRGDPVRLRRRIGYVFQGVGLFPHMTIAENVGAVPRLLGWDRGRIRKRVGELLEMVGLPVEEYAGRLPSALSGGQRQRVGLARALAAEPRVMLMDEPLGALDPVTRDGLQDELHALQRRLGLTVVLVTHDMTEALLMGDRIAVMQGGRIVRLGSAHEVMSDPQDAYAERLMAMPKRQADAVEAIARGGEGG
ncbi:MAG: ATP-binding cassette domain-containing protein [Phycisphaeraceae bacterium]|nr:MAG: ATP-binding cassette domain-containing protein [Phycisphaeraceae bacterium]